MSLLKNQFQLTYFKLFLVLENDIGLQRWKCSTIRFIYRCCAACKWYPTDKNNIIENSLKRGKNWVSKINRKEQKKNCWKKGMTVCTRNWTAVELWADAYTTALSHTIIVINMTNISKIRLRMPMCVLVIRPFSTARVHTHQEMVIAKNIKHTKEAIPILCEYFHILSTWITWMVFFLRRSFHSKWTFLGML